MGPLRTSCGEKVVSSSAIALGLALLVAIFSPQRSRAQQASSQASEQTQGINSGGYNVQQTIDFGYRLNEIGGNYDTYDTFVNLGSGMRLFDYELDMRSLNHQGLFFDDLNFSNFGYGGDPNDVSRLHIDMNKVYDFSALFRRDENFWDYNLFANPLNPAALNPLGSATAGCIVSPPSSTNPGLPGFCSNPAVAETNSPHALDLVRRMQDYDLTLLPQSKIRFRLGYSHDTDDGPGFFTTDSGTIPDYPQNYSFTTNAYRAGVDFRVLPRTTISYDQFLSYFRQDNTVTENPAATPQQYGYQANGVPVDLGIVWSTQTPAEALPCAAPIITNANTTPPTATTACNGFVSYSQVGQPRDFMPTERLRFESKYFTKFETSGSFGYSSSDNTVPNFNETMIGWTTRTSSPGGTTAGPAETKRDSVDGDWSGVYSVTNNFSIEDFFHYNNWRIPGQWDSELGSLFNTIAGAGLDLGAPVGFFVAANCNLANNFSGTTCPGHTAASAADLVDAYNANFLKQDMKSNSLEFEYDFTKQISGYIGYLYTHRDIVASSLSYTTEEIYYPGGATASATNDFLAARGNCALPLPTDCMPNPNGDGSIIYTPPVPTAGATVDSLDISENSLELGFKARPVDTLLLNGDFSFGYNDAAFTRIDPRQVQSYKLHASYTPKPWATVDGAVEIHENRDNVYYVDNLEHDCMYSFSTMLVPNPRLAISFGYNYWDVYTQSEICFNYSITAANPTPPGVVTTACPIPGASVGNPPNAIPPAVPGNGLGALSTYSSNDHFAHAELMWKPFKRVTANLGYGGSFVRGNTIFLNPLTPSGTLDYNYQMPYGSIVIDMYKGFSYKIGWNYYGFNETGDTNPFGLAAIPLQDFNGSNITFSFRYSF